MKLKCGPTWQEKEEARQQWHKWFAWFPVRVEERRCLWLETVERRWVNADLWGIWEYRRCA